MTCKTLFFDLNEREKKFFDKKEFQTFDIKFFEIALNKDTVLNLSDEDLYNTVAISVFLKSDISGNVINKFKNLRVISTRSSSCNHIEFKPCLEKHIALVNISDYEQKKDDVDYILKETLGGLSDFFCGGKRYRIF